MALRGHRRRGRHRGRTHQAKHEASLYRRDVLDGMALASDSISAPSERAHRCTLEELEVAQRRMFGGEVGDEELRRLGLLYQEPSRSTSCSSSSRHEHESTPVVKSSASNDVADEITPCFRTRSDDPQPVKHVRFLFDPSEEQLSEDEEWDVISLTPSPTSPLESESEAWEVLSEDL